MTEKVDHIVITCQYTYPKFSKRLQRFMDENGFDMTRENIFGEKATRVMAFQERKGANVEMPPTKPTPCPDCNGHGQVYPDGQEFPRYCKTCGGTGEAV